MESKRIHEKTKPLEGTWPKEQGFYHFTGDFTDETRMSDRGLLLQVQRNIEGSPVLLVFDMGINRGTRIVPWHSLHDLTETIPPLGWTRS